MLCAAGLAVKEPSTGVEFPLVRTFWVGDAQRNVGAGVRQKKLAFIGVKVRPSSRHPACRQAPQGAARVRRPHHDVPAVCRKMHFPGVDPGRTGST